MSDERYPEDIAVLAARLEAVDAELHRLRDHEEIRQALYSYARGTDRCERDMIAGAYHPDAVDHHGNFRGGRDEIADLISSNVSGATGSMHHLGNILIELDGDVANVESYFIAYQVKTIDGRDYTRARAGRYVDRFERREGRWRVAQRMVVDDWSRLDEIVTPAPDVTAECRIGTRTKLDPSYEVSNFHDAVPPQDEGARPS